MRKGIESLFLFFQFVFWGLLGVSCDDAQAPKLIGYDIPNYFTSQILAKEDTINKILATAKDYSSYLFFSDAHWEINQRHTPEIIRHIKDSTGINKVFFGGDAISGSSDKRSSYDIGVQFSKLFSFIHNFFPIVGNHDSNKSGNDDPDTFFSDDEVYDFLHQSLKNNPMVHYGHQFCYYVDDEEEKTRFICLDNGLRPMSTNSILFLCNALSDIADGWHIIILTHIIFDASNYYDVNTIYFSPVCDKIVKVAEAYNRHQKCHVSDEIEYDFELSMGHVEFIMGGHIHRDFISSSAQSIPLIALDCDCLYSYSIYGNGIGTLNEQCITAVVADYSNNQLCLVRFGRGKDLVMPIRK